VLLEKMLSVPFGSDTEVLEVAGQPTSRPYFFRSLLQSHAIATNEILIQ